MGLLDAPQNQTADALGRFGDIQIPGGPETAFGVPIRVFGPQAETAAGNLSQAAPGAGNDLKNLFDHPAGGLVAGLAHGTGVLVLDFRAPFLELFRT